MQPILILKMKQFRFIEMHKDNQINKELVMNIFNTD